MTVEMISRLISTNVLWPSWDLKLRPLDLKSNALPTELWNPAVWIIIKYLKKYKLNRAKQKYACEACADINGPD